MGIEMEWFPLPNLLFTLKTHCTVLWEGRDSHFLCIWTPYVAQMVDRLCVKVQDQLNSLRPSPQDDVQAEVLLAEKVMKDARNARTVRILLWAQKKTTIIYLQPPVPTCGETCFICTDLDDAPIKVETAIDHMTVSVDIHLFVSPSFFVSIHGLIGCSRNKHTHL